MSSRALLAAAVGAAALVIASTAFPRSTDTRACDLVSTSQIASILGYANVRILRDIPGKSSKDDANGVVHSVCNGVAWDGAAPASPAAVRLTVIGGHGVGFVIATWAPDTESTFVDHWTGAGFYRLTTAGLLSYYTTNLGFAPLHLHRLKQVGGTVGVNRALGMTGTPPGLSTVVGAAGLWWDDPSHSAVAIGIEQAAGKPTVAQLNQLAKIVAGGFGVKPLTLRP